MAKGNDIFIEKCLEILRKPEVKKEIKHFLKPIVDLVLQEVYPYIYLSVLFVIISFLLTLGIFVLMLRNSSSTINIK
jgi:hypothetical protein